MPSSLDARDRFPTGWLASLLALVILTFGSLAQSGYTTADDANAALLGRGNTLPTIVGLAHRQGRFQFLINWVAAILPYAVHNDFYYQAIKLGALTAGAIAFLLVINAFFRSGGLTFLAAVLYLAFLTNGWTHNLLTSYPFVFHLGLCFFLLALWFFVRFVRLGRRRDALGAAVAYFAALLTYEIFLAGLLLFVLLWYRRGRESATLKGLRIPHPRLLIGAVAPVVLFLALYVGFRAFYPSVYDGVQASGGTARGYLQVLWQYSIASIPGYLPFGLHVDVVRTAVVPGRNILAALLDDARPEWVAKAVVVGCAVFAVLRRGVSLTTSALLTIAGIGALVVFLPNVLVALSPKYQGWVGAGSHGYTTTYFSFLGSVLLISASSLAACRIGPQLLRSYVLPSLLALSATTLSAATDAFNHYIAEDQRQSYAKWRVVDALLASPEFTALPNGATIYAPSLWEYHGIVGLPLEYWTRYFTMLARRPIEVVEVQPENRALDYYLRVADDPVSHECFLVLARLLPPTQTGGLLAATSISIVAPQEGIPLVLEGSLVGDAEAEIKVDGRTVGSRNGRVFTASTVAPLPRRHFHVVRLESSRPVALRSLEVAFSFFGPEIAPLVARPARGFYSQESDGLGSTWNWSSGDADITIENTTGKRAEAQLSFTLGTLRPRHVWLSLDQGAKTMLLDESTKSSEIDTPLHLIPGVTRVRLETDVPGAAPSPQDPRSLAFRVHNIRLTSTSR